jgi:transcriptional regulator with XRE-family HTH domain
MEHNISFGQELNRFRREKSISQFDLAVRMDWSGTSPLIQIEKDRRIPKLETIEKLCRCLELDYIQRNYLLGLAGLLINTEIPQKKQVINTLEHVSRYMCNSPYPSFISDYKYRFWLFSPAVSVFAGGDYNALRQLLSKGLNVFDIYFNSKIGFNTSIENIEDVQNDQIFRYKATNLFRQHEDFFIDYPECMNYLQHVDYKAFERAWYKIDHNVLTDVKSIQIPDFYNRIEKGDVYIQFGEKPMYFHLSVMPILHLGDLFQLVTYVPVDSASLPENKAFVDSICMKYSSQKYPTLKLWDLMDVDKFFSK